MNYSHSRLEAMRRCPRSYQLQYIEGVPREPSPAMEMGSEVHKLIEEYGTHCYERGIDHDHKRAQVIAGGVTSEGAQRQFMRFVERHLWEWGGFVGGPAGQLFETWHQAPLRDLGLFRGRIDYCSLQAGQLRLRDWKSGPRQGWCYDEPPELPTLQLLRYGWLAMQEPWARDVEEIVLEQEFVGSGVVWAWDIDPGDLIEVEEHLCDEVRSVGETILALSARPLIQCPDCRGTGDSTDPFADDDACVRCDGLGAVDDWPMEPSSGCEYCGYRSRCPQAWQGEVRGPQDLVDLIDLYAAMRSYCNDQLKGWVSTHGPFEDRDGGLWDKHEESGGWMFDLSRGTEFLNLCAEAKRKPPKDMKALRKFAESPVFAGFFAQDKPRRKWGRRTVETADTAEQAEEE